eukprot:CAMPEP_0201867790 /NCGR_PEP_ID=MMETSP0902-20130614/1909_1 /ASSEMBLY_ACC=CAM_ASM_000551 /TAXON_ID=420261 /ORGANISM="Thalassiosira antarctica, Strain CCMP982" /LENGTH=458 /DNA_ID=CAMNT_0048393019 /DNA_START=278 /DNA_END=1654 /DNA_ORIENTATION=+
MATQLLAKGPLSSALGQWIFLGFGTFVLFTGDNGVGKAAQEIASVAFRLVTGRDGLNGAALLREAALNNSNLHLTGGQSQQQQPIVIHSVSSNSRSGGWTGTIIQLTLGAGACWTAYLVFSNFLPEQIKEMLPVTRKFFESAVTSLGQGIIAVRDHLSEQIAKLGIKQDKLSTKQDETHDQVLGIKDDIGDVRLHIDDIAVAISRCENSLGDAAGRQTYMSRGVRLLVQCVGDLLRQGNPAVAEELDQFSRLSAELMDDDSYYKESSSSARNSNGGGDSSGSPNKRHRQHLEYPSSPNMSEIGSTTSTMMDDHHHHHNHSNMRSLSLPHTRRSQSVVTPSSSSSKNTTAHPNSTPKVMTHSNMTNPPPSLLRTMSSPPGALKMLQSFNSRNSNATATTASTSSSYSSPENEVPQSNAGRVTPPGESNGTDMDRLKDMKVEELLRFVRSGGTSSAQTSD